MRERCIGVVDIGSNTVHLLVASTNGRSVTRVLDRSEALRLGLDLDSSGAISEEKTKKLVLVLGKFQREAEAAGASRLHLLGTQSLRAVTNHESVFEAVTAKTGLTVTLLTPKSEAELAFMGADAICPSIGPQAMVDIGGGSVQIAVGVHGQVWDSVSLPIGAARLAGQFFSDPPTYVEQGRLATYLGAVLPPALPLRGTAVTGVLGVGGTPRRLPDLLGGKTGEIAPSGAAERLLDMLRNRSSSYIASTYGLKQDRAAQLIPTIMLLREIVRGYSSPPLILCEYGLREGAVLAIARQSEQRVA